MKNEKLTEPDFILEKGEWLVWSMIEQGNNFDTACKLLTDKLDAIR